MNQTLKITTIDLLFECIEVTRRMFQRIRFNSGLSSRKNSFSAFKRHLQFSLYALYNKRYTHG